MNYYARECFRNRLGEFHEFEIQRAPAAACSYGRDCGNDKADSTSPRDLFGRWMVSR